MDFVFLLGRIIFGGYFVINGIKHFIDKKALIQYAHSKHVPSPEFAVTFTGALLFTSGICIVFGIFVYIALAALIMFLFITSFTIHAYWKDTDSQIKMNNYVNFMKNIALLGASLMMFFIEDWPFSL